jgi:hypothetical protein
MYVKSSLEARYMGVCRDASECEIEFVKEMAEGLGSSGIILDNLLEKARMAKMIALDLIEKYHASPTNAPDTLLAITNKRIKEYNSLVEKAEEALRWLLIQREACGFRTHKNVSQHYPLPPRLPLIKG